jgi:hypothetical protein
MTLHKLKTWPVQFGRIRAGIKRFEIRRDDREFRENDLVVFQEFVPDVAVAAEYVKATGECRDLKIGYTGYEIGPYRIDYIERSKCLPDGWCGFSMVLQGDVTEES